MTKKLSVFTPDLWFCSSRSTDDPSQNASRAVKILWKHATDAELEAPNQLKSNVQELEVPKILKSPLLDAIEKNQLLLPKEMRDYSDGWHASLLRRFDPGEVENG